MDFQPLATLPSLSNASFPSLSVSLSPPLSVSLTIYVSLSFPPLQLPLTLSFSYLAVSWLTDLPSLHLQIPHTTVPFPWLHFVAFSTCGKERWRMCRRVFKHIRTSQMSGKNFCYCPCTLKQTCTCSQSHEQMLLMVTSKEPKPITLTLTLERRKKHGCVHRTGTPLQN